ncbi:hypothetical protein O6H91_06G096200 [Diphasiastrum complanatum]|uniref:Uncharacterized protein n=5 Tax=Diphasiastrum complanatum TaxID=34168 RepID=A0ACC2DGE1_DIPCM|nr:hypothetical protein O6H91_06G096200 [Diphasiastrum complanatum]KAJ7553394.1 hypothetical protein O6H91_06G096200 [Diphasiastrum complanatum]KAJ7553395.1 hypothetical protein O6H91_06G096200 [Diphasiastrum complanatum]KAJ7553396.1 hypothetical protein O6H91_06G096200 [Diphasiastrum complanatum]KAJ7553397.1 hypothetical protein O6H91_06G096200 [Diphasiastrum complanatum]
MATRPVLMRVSRRVRASLLLLSGFHKLADAKQARGAIGSGIVSLERIDCQQKFSFRAAHEHSVTYSTAPATIHKSYANDLLSYNKALMSLNWQRRAFLLRDVYEDMLLDGVQPVQDSFYLLLKGCTKGSRVQDALFFFKEMKSMGLVPDVLCYNWIIAVCGKCNHFDHAFQVWQEMEAYGGHATLETFLSLLNACAVSGRTDKVYDVLEWMTARGIASNDYSYAALIITYMNKKPVMQEASEKIFDLLQQWRNGAAKDFKAQAVTREVEISNELEDELCTLALGDLQMRRGVVNRRLLVYYAAFRAFANFKNMEDLRRLLEIFENDGHEPDAFCVLQTIRCNLACGDFNSALSDFDKYIKSGKQASLDLYVEIIHGALLKYSDVGMAAAKRLLREMDEKGFFLNPKVGSELLGTASKETAGDFSTANLVWDMMQKWKIKPQLGAVIPYYNGLQAHGVPATDPRASVARKLLEENNRKFSWSAKKASAVQTTHVEEESDPDAQNAESIANASE